MIIDIWKLKKECDLLKWKTTILGLYILDSEVYLGSMLKGGISMVFYPLDYELLRRYFNSEITLYHLYWECADIIVARKYKEEVNYFLKIDMLKLIKWGDKFYAEIPNEFKNSDFEFKIFGA